MRKAKGIQRRLVAYSLGLVAIVALSFVWLSQRSLRSSLAERQEDYHTTVYRISNEYLNDYLYALDGKIDAVARLPSMARYLDRPVDHADFSSISAALQNIASVLSKRFWPQNKADALVFLGPGGADYLFALGAEPQYLGEDFDFGEFIASRPELAALGPGKSALLYNPASGGIKLAETMVDRLIFAKRLEARDGSSSGLVIAVLAQSFMPALFSGLAEGSSLSVRDASGALIWSNGAAASSSRRVVRNIYVMDAAALGLTVSTDLELAYPALGRPDLVVALAAAACLALVAALAPFLARRSVQSLDELAGRLAEYSDEGSAGVEEARTLPLPGSSIRARLLAYFVLTAVLPVAAFIGLASWRSYAAIDEAVSSYVSATIRQAETYIDYNFDVYDELTSQFIYDDDFQASWPAGLAGPLPEAGKSFVDGYFARMARSKGEFFALNLYAKDGHPVYVGLETEGSYLGSVLKTRLARLDKSIGQLILIGAVENQYRKNLLVFARKVRGLRYYGRPDLGYALFFVEPYQLFQVYGMLGTNLSKYLFVVDDERNVLAGFGAPADEGAKSANANTRGGGRMRIDAASASWDYAMVGRIPSGELRLILLPVVLAGFYIITAHVAVIMLLSGLFASSFMRPIRRLAATMRDFGPDGDLSEGLAGWAAGRGELAEIATRFNDLVLENYRGRLRANELAVLEREAQLNALQQQINPHFMYNTLEAIKWMAYRRGEREICDMASAMGKFLRGNMALGEHFTSLAEEIEHLKSYLFIQQMRYGERFEVQWEIEEGLSRESVPRLILQPIVENAIDHGFEDIRYKGSIAIRARRALSGMELSIEDNGRGMGEETLARVREGIESGSLGSSESIGLANVSRRLKLTLGPLADMRIESEEGGGTRIVLFLPIVDRVAQGS